MFKLKDFFRFIAGESISSRFSLDLWIHVSFSPTWLDSIHCRWTISSSVHWSLWLLVTAWFQWWTELILKLHNPIKPHAFNCWLHVQCAHLSKSCSALDFKCNYKISGTICLINIQFGFMYIQIIKSHFLQTRNPHSTTTVAYTINRILRLYNVSIAYGLPNYWPERLWNIHYMYMHCMACFLIAIISNAFYYWFTKHYLNHGYRIITKLTRVHNCIFLFWWIIGGSFNFGGSYKLYISLS